MISFSHPWLPSTTRCFGSSSIFSLIAMMYEHLTHMYGVTHLIIHYSCIVKSIMHAVSVHCYTDWSFTGTELSSSPFDNIPAISALDCYSRCEITSGFTFSLFAVSLGASTGSCRLMGPCSSSSSSSSSSLGCTGKTGEYRATKSVETQELIDTYSVKSIIPSISFVFWHNGVLDRLGHHLWLGLSLRCIEPQQLHNLF